MSFLEVRFPELESLPLDERRQIVDRCLAAPSVRRLSKQKMWSVRAVLLLLPVGIALQFLHGPDGEVPEWVVWAMFAIILVVLIAVPALFFGYWRRIVAELRILVRKELERRK